MRNYLYKETSEEGKKGGLPKNISKTCFLSEMCIEMLVEHEYCKSNLAPDKNWVECKLASGALSASPCYCLFSSPGCPLLSPAQSVAYSLLAFFPVVMRILWLGSEEAISSRVIYMVLRGPERLNQIHNSKGGCPKRMWF